MPKTIHSEAYRALIRRLRDRRLELGLTQAQLAANLGRDRNWLHRVEIYETRADFLQILDLLKALKIKIDEAVRLVQEKAP